MRYRRFAHNVFARPDLKHLVLGKDLLLTTQALEPFGRTLWALCFLFLLVVCRFCVMRADLRRSNRIEEEMIVKYQLKCLLNCCCFV